MVKPLQKKRCRGKAFPQEFIKSSDPSNRECSAQDLKHLPISPNRSEEGSAFANRDFGGDLGDVGANAKPLRYVQITFSLPCGSAGGENVNLVDANMKGKASEAIEGNQRNKTMIHSF